MKKLVALLLASTLVAAFSLNAFAAGSISIGTVDTSEGKTSVTDDAGEALTATDKDGNVLDESLDVSIAIEVTDMSVAEFVASLDTTDPEEIAKVETVITEINTVDAETTLDDVLNTDTVQIESLQIVNTSGVATSGVFESLEDLKFLSDVMDVDVVISGDDADEAVFEVSADNPVKVTFTVNNLVSGVKVYILHYCEGDTDKDNGHGWELLETSTSGNQISAMFHSTSPIVFVYDTNSVSSDPDSGSDSGSDSSSSGSVTVTDVTVTDITVEASPKTGESMVWVVMATGMASCAILLALNKKKLYKK